MNTLTYGQWLKNQTSKFKYKDGIYGYLEHCKNNSIKLPDDLKIQMLNEISEKPQARDELQQIMADRVSISAVDSDGVSIKKSIIYFDWLKLFNLNDDPDQRVEFVKFCKLNNLFLSEELTIFYLRFDEKESVSSEADYMMWQLNDDASLLIEAAADDHEDAIHALADIMDFGSGGFVENTDAIFFRKLNSNYIDERYYKKSKRDEYLRELADDWLRTSAMKGCISSKYKMAHNEISRIMWRCLGELQDRKYDRWHSEDEFNSAWHEIIGCAREGNRAAIEHLIQFSDIESMTYDKYVEYFSERVRPINIEGE